MRIIVSTDGKIINGVAGTESFSVLFNQEVFDSLMSIQKESEEVQTVVEFNTLVDKVKAIITETKVENEATKNPYLYFNKSKNAYYLKYNKVISTIEIPQVLVDCILLSMDKGIDYMPVIKMWARFLRNKKAWDDDFRNYFANYLNIKVLNPELYNSLVDEKGFAPEVAREMAMVPSMQISKEGMLCCYKVSREIDWKWELDEEGNPVRKDLYVKKKSIDPISGLITYEEPEMPMAEERLFEPPVMGQRGDAFYCVSTDFSGDFSKETPGHVIKVGKIITHDSWSKVNCDDESSCVKGLHVGGIDYIRGYQGSNTQTHNVVVDPADIGAICDDNTGAMRVLRYYVQDVFKGVNGSIYHSSKYAAFTDDAFKKFIAETLRNEQESAIAWKKETDKAIEELSDLV